MEQVALQSIIVNNHDLRTKEVNGQRVVTFRDVDELHERPDGTAKRNFNENKEHFIEGEDYYKICADEIRTNKIMDISPKTHQDTVFLTEFGYLMLVKSFTDKLAWQVQRQLINVYFRAKQNSVEFSQNNPTNCTILNDTIQVLQSMQKSLIDCTMKHGYILQDHEKQFDDVYEEIKSLENVIEMKNTDLRDEIQNEFYHINETIEKLKAIKKPTMSVAPTIQHPTGKALAHSIIKPLAEARNDITRGYNYTYRLVYSEMGVSWSNRLSRYANKHKSKNKPSKINLLVSDSKLLSLFEDTVNRLLSEFYTQEVEHEEDC